MIGIKIPQKYIYNDGDLKNPPLSQIKKQKQFESGKFGFEHFLKSLEVIAMKIFDNKNIDTSLTILLEKYILNLKKNHESANEKKEISIYCITLKNMMTEKNIVNLYSKKLNYYS